jgi:ubiquinone biosynthesis protein
VSLSLIVSALTISSSLLVLSGKGPEVFGISAIGAVGLLFALFLGFVLVFAILRSGEI